MFFLNCSEIHRRRQWHPTPVLLPGKFHGRRSLVGCSPWGRWESDTTERLHFHFSLSCIGEGNGRPLQCSCLENPRAARAWWAAVYGVTQSRTRLKRLSSSSRDTLTNLGLPPPSSSTSETSLVHMVDPSAQFNKSLKLIHFAVFFIYVLQLSSRSLILSAASLSLLLTFCSWIF